jgi:hypothetical protein
VIDASIVASNVPSVVFDNATHLYPPSAPARPRPDHELDPRAAEPGELPNDPRGRRPAFTERSRGPSREPSGAESNPYGRGNSPYTAYPPASVRMGDRQRHCSSSDPRQVGQSLGHRKNRGASAGAPAHPFSRASQALRGSGEVDAAAAGASPQRPARAKRRLVNHPLHRRGSRIPTKGGRTTGGGCHVGWSPLFWIAVGPALRYLGRHRA